MEWLRSHPYSTVLATAGAVVIIGVLFVNARAPVTPSQGSAWDGAGVALRSSYAGGPQVSQNPSLIPVQSNAPYTYILPTPRPSNNGGDDVANDGFDYDAFIAMLTQESAKKSAPTPTSPTPSAYAFIPTGLISIATAPKRSALQQSLYDYGNEVGSFIQSFEQDHPAMTQILTDQIQDPTDAGKAAIVVSLGQSLARLGTDISTIDPVPSQVSAAHTALTRSYQSLGAKLALVPQAQGSANLVAAIRSYDDTVGAFTKNYVTLANLFVAYGVTFSPQDPGSVFTFTPTSSF